MSAGSFTRNLHVLEKGRKARIYSPNLARFLQPDSIVPGAGNPQNLNRYAYVLNSPVNFVDPTGHFCEGGYLQDGFCISKNTTQGQANSYISHNTPTQSTCDSPANTHLPACMQEPAPLSGDPKDRDAESDLGDDLNRSGSNGVDPIKPDPTTPWQVGFEWLTGTGPRDRSFEEGDYFLELLRGHSHIQNLEAQIVTDLSTGNYVVGDPVRANYSLAGIKGVPLYIQDYSNLLTGGNTGNLAVTYTGSYGLTYTITDVNLANGTAQVDFYVTNASTLASATHPPVLGYSAFWNTYISPAVNSLVEGDGPLSATTQEFSWTVTLSFGP